MRSVIQSESHSDSGSGAGRCLISNKPSSGLSSALPLEWDLIATYQVLPAKNKRANKQPEEEGSKTVDPGHKLGVSSAEEMGIPMRLQGNGNLAISM